MMHYIITIGSSARRVTRNVIAHDPFRALCIAIDTIPASDRPRLEQSQLFITTKPMGRTA